MEKTKAVEIDITELKPYKKNARVHSKEQIKLIAKSIKKYGFINPVLIDDKMMIIAGHGRVEAAKSIGVKTAPCIQVSHLSEKKKREYILADNRLAELAEWDEDLLAEELAALNINIGDLGFDDSFMRPEKKKLGDDEAVPEAEELAATKVGQVWTLGDHVLMVGDSTSQDDVATLMGDKKADMVYTDPPYNVNIEGKAGKIMNDHMADDHFKTFLDDVFKNYFHFMEPGAVIYVAHADSERVNFTKAFTDAGFKLAQVLIWVKNTATLSRQDYNWRHEPVLYGWKEGAAHYYDGDFKKNTVIESEIEYGSMSKTEIIDLCKKLNDMVPSTVIKHDRPTKAELHPTMKPVAMVASHIESSSTEDSIVMDLFGGSGSTLIACEKTNRSCRMMELDPIYADVIIKRWQEYTGGTAYNVGTGQPFDDITPC